MILPKAVKLSFSKLPPNWSYLKVSVVTPVNLDITDIEFKSAIMQSLQVSTGFRSVNYITWVLILYILGFKFLVQIMWAYIR